MVTLRLQKNLRLMHQPAKGLTVDDPVRIPLVAGTDILLPGFIGNRSSLAAIRKGCALLQTLMLLLL
jgi:hypothetical protein